MCSTIGYPPHTIDSHEGREAHRWRAAGEAEPPERIYVHFSFEGFGDDRDEICEIVRFAQHCLNSRLMGLLLYLVGDISRIQNEGNGAEIRAGFYLKQ